jgi:hypothetical protein
MAKIQIPTDSLKEDFQKFLSIGGNDRIIFSGIFGIGKTTFLKDFFDKDNKDYIGLRIYPVNYSVTQNEDIFELIKYDILYSLLEKNPPLEVFEPTTYDTLWYYLNSKDKSIKDILSFFFKDTPKIAKPIVKVWEGIESLETVLQDIRRKRLELTEGDNEKLTKFAKTMESEYAIYENDINTELITKIIQQLRNKENKRIVLIIDDLDRIDPEHIFRILNVFAAHFDHEHEVKTENKFGIDKIMLCCDIDNIRKIFLHKYGSDVDFNGYIDKFYSTHIFTFNQKYFIKQILETIITNIESVDSNFKNNIRQNSSVEFNTLYRLIDDLNSSNKINLRTLLKYCKTTEYKPQNYTIPFPERGIQNTRIHLCIVFDFLIAAFGSIDALEQAFKTITIEFAKNNLQLFKFFVGQIIFISQHRAHRFGKGIYECRVDGHKINYEISLDVYNAKIIKINDAEPDSFNQTINLNEFLRQALGEYKLLTNKLPI